MRDKIGVILVVGAVLLFVASLIGFQVWFDYKRLCSTASFDMSTLPSLIEGQKEGKILFDSYRYFVDATDDHNLDAIYYRLEREWQQRLAINEANLLKATKTLTVDCEK